MLGLKGQVLTRFWLGKRGGNIFGQSVGVVVVKDQKCARGWPREKKKIIEWIDEVGLVRCPNKRQRKILGKMDSRSRKVPQEVLGTW